MSSPYDTVRTGGSLKLKGEGSKKKKKSKSKGEREDAKDSVKAELLRRGKATSPVPEDSSSGPSSSTSTGYRMDNKTDAQRRFEEIQRQRRAEKVAKMAKMTHKDRVHEFNSKLESLSEHHDIPKVGPG